MACGQGVKREQEAFIKGLSSLDQAACAVPDGVGVGGSEKAPPLGGGCLTKANTDIWAGGRKPGSLEGCWLRANVS